MSGVRLVCPRSRRLLEPRVVAGRRELVSDDGSWAYRVDGDVPVLLAPEALEGLGADPRDGRYDEAYDEMQYYDALARRCAVELRRAIDGRGNVDPLRASDDPVREGLRLAALAATSTPPASRTRRAPGCTSGTKPRHSTTRTPTLLRSRENAFSRLEAWASMP